VRLRTTAGEATLPARVTSGIASGCVFVPWNQPGFAANTILSGQLTTDVTLEPVEAKVSA
jgi:predicted molibdopterin-dependent oxidoreductase YjgC